MYVLPTHAILSHVDASAHAYPCLGAPHSPSYSHASFNLGFTSSSSPLPQPTPKRIRVRVLQPLHSAMILTTVYCRHQFTCLPSSPACKIPAWCQALSRASNAWWMTITLMHSIFLKCPPPFTTYFCCSCEKQRWDYGHLTSFMLCKQGNILSKWDSGLSPSTSPFISELQLPHQENACLGEGCENEKSSYKIITVNIWERAMCQALIIFHISMYLILTRPYARYYFSPILQVRTLRHEEVK